MSYSVQAFRDVVRQACPVQLSHVSLETGVSWPLPERPPEAVERTVHLHFLLYMVLPRPSEGGQKIYRPHARATIVINPESGALIRDVVDVEELETLAGEENQSVPVGVWPPPHLASQPPEAWPALEGTLDALYPEAIRSFARNYQTYNPTIFLFLIDVLWPTGLLSFYHKLNPAFFEWLKLLAQKQSAEALQS